ncbi:MAG: hypothetical protein ACLRTA_00370 [Clostridia bacterium]
MAVVGLSEERTALSWRHYVGGSWKDKVLGVMINGEQFDIDVAHKLAEFRYKEHGDKYA